MFVNPLALLFSNAFASFSVFLSSLPSMCCKRLKLSKGVPAYAIKRTDSWLSAPAIEHVDQDRVHHDWVHGTGSSTSTYTRYSRIALGHCILNCTMGLWSSWVQSSTCTTIERMACDRAHLFFLDSIHFPINRTTCINFKTYILWGPFESISLCLVLLSLFNCQTLLA